MFERAFGKILNHFLSKYFDCNNNNNNNNNIDDLLTNSVWSGYIVLEHLTLKSEILEDVFLNANHSAVPPVDVVHCGIRRLEISVPWAKISSLSSSSAAAGVRSTNHSNDPDHASASSSSYDVVIVLDGIHILLSTLSSDADESSMRKEAVKVGARRLRKRQLEQVEGQYHHQNQHTYRSAATAAAADSPASSYASSFSYLKEKLALGLNLASAGILHDVLERMQLHLRNVHIRWEGEFTFRFIVLVEFGIPFILK